MMVFDRLSSSPNTGLQHIVESLKSVILALALVDRHLNVETAVALSRLEEEYQVLEVFLHSVDYLVFAQ